MAKVTSLLFIVPVRDLDRAVKFYNDAFELEVVFRNEGIAFVGIPGTDASMGLLLDPEHAGDGPQNVGLHVDHALNRDDLLRDVEAAGGKIVERGNHAPDVPFARIADIDGNVLEI
ncbi:MAG TPA: VOC family protein [Dehalococcoidia bacterium]|jgi:predicted enzyme related to lactoylglutathione lyase|nr:VOC family protein [Dehalococcoidia bacterium]